MTPQMKEELSALKIYLNELRSEHERLERAEEDRAASKDVQRRIKYLECQINVMEWDPRTSLQTERTTENSSRMHNAED